MLSDFEILDEVRAPLTAVPGALDGEVSASSGMQEMHRRLVGALGAPAGLLPTLGEAVDAAASTLAEAAEGAIADERRIAELEAELEALKAAPLGPQWLFQAQGEMVSRAVAELTRYAGVGPGAFAGLPEAVEGIGARIGELAVKLDRVEVQIREMEQSGDRLLEECDALTDRVDAYRAALSTAGDVILELTEALALAAAQEGTVRLRQAALFGALYLRTHPGSFRAEEDKAPLPSYASLLKPFGYQV